MKIKFLWIGIALLAIAAVVAVIPGKVCTGGYCATIGHPYAYIALALIVLAVIALFVSLLWTPEMTQPRSESPSPKDADGKP